MGGDVDWSGVMEDLRSVARGVKNARVGISRLPNIVEFPIRPVHPEPAIESGSMAIWNMGAAGSLDDFPRPKNKLMANFGAVTLSYAIYALLAFVLQGGLNLDSSLVVGIAGGIAPLITVIVMILRERREKRKQHADALDRVSELTADERDELRKEYAQLRKEEREHMERVVSGYIRIAETARKRSHVLANGYMQFQLAHQSLVDLTVKHNIEVPEKLLLRGAMSEILARLEEITEHEPPSP